MLAFQVNLLRNRPLPPAQRPAVVRVLTVSLFCAGALLAWECNQAARRVLAVRDQARALQEQQQAFVRTHPGFATPQAYRNELRTRLQGNETACAAVSRVIARHRPAATLLYSLVAPLPPDVHLVNLDLNLTAGNLRFELALPLNQPGRTNDIPTLLEVWGKDPVLQQWVSGLHEMNSEEAKIGGEAIFVVRFVGDLPLGGG